MKLSSVPAFLLLATATSSNAFTSPALTTKSLTIQQRANGMTTQFVSSDKSKEEEAVFMPDETANSEEKPGDEEIPLETVEKLGKGAAKVCLLRVEVWL